MVIFKRGIRNPNKEKTFHEETKAEAQDKEIYPLLPLRDIVIFPHMVVPLFVGRPKSILALEEALKTEKYILLVTQRNANVVDPAPKEIYTVGTLGLILQFVRLEDGSAKILVEGKKRVEILDFSVQKEFFMAQVKEIEEENKLTPEMEAWARTLCSTFENYVKLNRKILPEVTPSILNVSDHPSRLVDIIIPHLSLRLEDRQEILETLKIKERIKKVLKLMEHETEVLQIEKKIRNRVKKQIEKSQKEYYLTEQMRAIQKEIGGKDEIYDDLKDLEEKIKRKEMTPETTEKIKKEFKKLKLMAPMSAEFTVVRNYIDWIISLPWQEKTEIKKDIKEAKKILDEDHYGLDKVKERILEYLAVQSLVEHIKGPILCFVGPPGVGKTSLAKSIARATGRNFVRLSLGGVRDEAEIRGHRRTYIGSLPGKIIQHMKKAGSNNPLFLLDEIDKMGTDFRGDPAAALLEVLDSEQNCNFNDHYIDVDYNLSEVFFITTANTLYGIPHPLLDRMEVIRMPGYIDEEKVNIAKRFLIPKQIEANGLKEANIRFTDATILSIIQNYAKEAGVRNLEREIATICRKVARMIMEKGEGVRRKIINPSNLPNFLGVPKYRYEKMEDNDEVGVAKGLAWTEAGGELLSIETTILPGKGKLTITGQLGKVMQESAQAALSYVRSRAETLGLEKDFYHKLDIHIHVPEGAIPKDGPSAGIALATSIISGMTKRPIKKDIAMTGEITLRGRILPIGGLKEKILAALRENISEVFIPKENERNLKEIPPKSLKAITITLVNHMDQVIEKAIIMKDRNDLMEDPSNVRVYRAEVAEKVIAH